jgi:clan AA aspartic protease
MGAFSVEFEIGDREGRRFHRIAALVDTGAACTWIPASILRAVGAQPEEMREFVLADGRSVSCGFGWATIRLSDRVQPTPVISRDDGSEPLLGVVTLESSALAWTRLTSSL